MFHLHANKAHFQGFAPDSILNVKLGSILKVEPFTFPVNVSIKTTKQGLSLGCPKGVSPTVVKKLQVQDDRTLFDSDDEMHSTDANRDEREEENDPRMESDDITNKKETADGHKNEKRGDDHSITTQVCHNVWFC